MTREPSVFVVDDNPEMRRSTAILLESALFRCNTYESPTAFFDDYHADLPGCLLLNVHEPGVSGMEFIEELDARNSTLPVLFHSSTARIAMVVEAIKHGVFDFLEMPVPPEVLIPKVRAAFELDAQRRSRAAGQAQVRQRFAHLTARENELVELLLAGATNKLIAAELGISVKTVENHRAHIMAKTGATNAVDLVRISHLAKSS